jgi:hypothetical protein
MQAKTKKLKNFHPKSEEEQEKLEDAKVEVAKILDAQNDTTLMKESSQIIDSLITKAGSAEIDALKRLQEDISSIRAKAEVEKLLETFAATAVKDNLKQPQESKEAKATTTTVRATEISFDEINLLYGNLDEFLGLNGGPTIGNQLGNPQLDIFIRMLAAGAPGIGAEKTARGYNISPDIWQELKQYIDHDMMRQVFDRVVITDGLSTGKKPIRKS